MLLLLTLALYLFIALFSYDGADPGWSHSGGQDPVANNAGVVGAWFADIVLYLLGYVAYLLPVLVGFVGWLVFRGRNPERRADTATTLLRWVGFLILLLTATGLARLHFTVGANLPIDSGGGVLGDLIASGMVEAFSFLGATLFLLALFLAGFTLLTGISWLHVMDWLGKVTLAGIDRAKAAIAEIRERIEAARIKQLREDKFEIKREKKAAAPPVRIEPQIQTVPRSERAEKARQKPLFETRPEPGLPGDLPSVALLVDPPVQHAGYSEETLKALSLHLEERLADFGVEATVEAVHPGPVITRFEILPAAGVKVSKISGLAKDLARAMSVMAVRVVEVIPGKPTVGIEIPNEKREIVYFSEIIASQEFDKSGAMLPFALGKDIGGKAVVVDMAKMPHLLVAGTTGSGKSVGVNSMIMSLLFKRTPDEVRLIMIDPKMLELSVYEGIPHLLCPVVTDMKEAANALRWSVAEMERRYKLMAAMGVRNIAGFNKKVREARKAGEPLLDPLWKPTDGLSEEADELETLPFIVVIVDEFADMMMVVGKKVEELIARLAQKARAAGIHLILATQRPSVDVITGLIKANIPTRIAFQVSSRIDSRTILDQQGAEHLLGHGDMLYLPPGTAIPQRVHGAFVDDPEVHAVVEKLISESDGPNYIDGVLEGGPEEGGAIPGLEPIGGGDDGESDPLYDQAVAIVCETRKASISGVQRRLKIGYNRAARLVETMEMAGVVGALGSNGQREVLAPPPPRD
ncbi:MAG: DNA translocase FtsK 4TM domain-containing protein [Gammaproteobacteria bacterium]|nr:DNA translocase FtsK 4TM domain-containing protein [Gammaproteobacteria bacterium]MCP5135305.1 DNA translocase FtsK 4TM domain-containing protein [Gammaproteobacteria bacterium]